MLRRIFVGDNERVFLIRNGRFEDILAPGDYWILGFGVELERHDLKQIVLISEWKEFLVKERWALVFRYFTMVETSEVEVAVVYFDDKVSRVVGPGQRVLFWNGPVTVTYDLIDAHENPQVPALLMPAVLRLGRESQATFAVVEEGKLGLAYLDGRLVRELTPGTYAFWNAAGTPRIKVTELRSQKLTAH
jgi:hypothetical protein